MAIIVDGIRIGAGGSAGWFRIDAIREPQSDSNNLRCHTVAAWFIDVDGTEHELLSFYIFTPEEVVDDEKLKHVVLAELARESFPVYRQ